MSIAFRMPSRIVHKHAVPVGRRPAGMKGAIAENFARVDWRNETIAGEGGSYWLGKGARETLKRTRYVSIRNALERHGASPRDLCLPILEEANFEIIHDENETLIGKNRNV